MINVLNNHSQDDETIFIYFLRDLSAQTITQLNSNLALTDDIHIACKIKIFFLNSI